MNQIQKHTQRSFKYSELHHEHVRMNRKKDQKHSRQQSKVNFTPFQHWKFDGDNTIVGKSRGDGMQNGYQQEVGRTTNELARTR